MAGALVGGAFLSAFLQVAFDRVASREVLDFLKGRKDIWGLLRKLKIKLLSANAVLNDAEEKQITDPAVKEWLDELQDAVYDADELLDEIAYEGLRYKIEADSQTTGTSLVQNPIPIPSSVSSFEFEKILENLEFVIEQMGVLGLKEVSGGVPVPVPSPRISTSCQEKCGVFGREVDKEAIFRLLQSNEASSDEICVVPIVGMGGIGKTTLAQFVYNDSRVDQSFDLKAWVCVSENFNSFEIFKTIYEEVTLSPCKFENLTTLQTEIRKALKGKRFFLVLDDVWNENYNKWDDLLKVFKCEAQEVKIIVTTRSERAASIVQTIPTHHCLKELSDDMCWDLFVKHAFGNAKSYADFEVIGKQIVKKCGGLPLAIKTVGGSLRSNKNPTHWKKILKNHIWDLPEAKTNILPALRLSYHYLPSHLKRCFAYCSIFPKDYEFNKEELILLWMAEGLLEQPKEDTSMDSMEFEEIGEEYFNDLVSRSFFQQSNKSESCFLMHDLINDLAKSISGKVCFSSLDDESNVITKKTRYFLLYGAYYHGIKKFEICYEAKGLRTFLVEAFSSTWFNDCYKIEKKMDDLLETFKCLRVLSWSKCVYIRDLPVSIGNLQHLRYLNIYGTDITHLPDSLCRLYNLQTLILSSQITNLPTNMGKLINLRHLDNSQSHMKEMPPQMGKLKKLRKLPVFVVGKHGGSSIRELGELHHLSGKLSILNLENVHCTIDDPEIPKVMLKDKQDLTELVLEWDFLRYIEDSIKEKSLLEQLCPHTNLNSLTIKYYGGTSFPNWLGDSSFLNMVSLKLDSCMYCFALPPLGQLPTLKKLEIYGLVRVVAVGREFYGNGYSTIKPFRSLEYLSFAYMLEWKEWVTFEDKVFSRLQELHIGGAPKLSVLPNCLPSLTKLEIRRCEQLVSLPRAPVLHEIELLWNWKIQFASGHYYPSLECMTMRGVCDSMSLEFFPKLKYIIIYDCENFEYLTSFEIKNCPNFISFPSGGLRAPKLTKMKFESCNKLQSLPKGMHTLLPSLVTLELLDCPELESFPEGGLPSNLVKLEISSCNKLISCRMEWGLQSLHSLKEFSIAHKYEEVDSFPEEVLLPPSLTYFSILDFSNMKSLNGKGFQHLTSLKTLSIELCHKLECLPEEGLPTSLSQLHILGCPLLKKRCEKEKGEDWLKIVHIPNIVMSYESLNASAQLQGLLDCV